MSLRLSVEGDGRTLAVRVQTGQGAPVIIPVGLIAFVPPRPATGQPGPQKCGVRRWR